jgi:hypothetical protein
MSEFEASLVYKVSSRTARATQRIPVSERKEEREKERERKLYDMPQITISLSLKKKKKKKGCIFTLCPPAKEKKKNFTGILRI